MSYPEVPGNNHSLSKTWLRFCYRREKCNFILRVFVFYGFWCECAMDLVKDKICRNTEKEELKTILKININL